MNNIYFYLAMVTGGLIFLLIFIDIVSDFWYWYQTEEMIRLHKQAAIMNRIRKGKKNHGNKV